ncbi:hypothetical protein F5Y16DRAFT_424186 [Xylariaceae sp. FL0255]|nr:hypothetical protein F5Y16DRAFT_424186 [Xylariaceae sp. FL0255]
MADDTPASADYAGWKLKIFITVFLPIQVAAVLTRSYSQNLIGANFGIDCGLVLASLVSQFVIAGVSLGGVIQGAVGYHIDFLERTNPDAITLFFKYLVVFSVWYFATVSIAKGAICVLYSKLSPQRIVRVTIHIIIIVLILTALSGAIADLAACRPFSANWGRAEVQKAHCMNKEALFIWITLPNILTDVVLLLLPLPIVWNLQATRQLKAALTITFLFGSLGLIASIMRFVAFNRTDSFTDGTFHAVELLIWTNAEPWDIPHFFLSIEISAYLRQAQVRTRD